MKNFSYHFLSLLALLTAWQAQAQCPQPTLTGIQVLCSNSTVTLTVQGNYSSYAWSNGSNTASTVITTPGPYQVTVTCSNGSTAIGGANVQGLTTGIAVLGNGTICAGQCAQANILATNSGNTGPFTLVLGLSTGGTETIILNGIANLFTINLCPTETTTYTILSFTNSQGCEAFINPNLASDDVTVIGGNLDIIGPSSLCNGQTATLTANPANFQTYTWSNGASGSSTTISSPGTYSVTATAAGGCSATASITIDPVPFTPPTITGGGPLCPGSSLELTVGGSYSSYSWSTGQSGQSITISTPGTYTVTVSDANGCTGTDSEVVSPGATANTNITGPSSICPNAQATLTAAGNFASYLWSNGETSSSINVTSAGSYTVTVTDGAGCTGTASLTLGSSPLPSVSFSAPNPEVCAGACLNFNVTFTGTPPFNLTYTSGSSGPLAQIFNANAGTLQICPPVGSPPGPVTLSAVSLTDANCVCD